MRKLPSSVVRLVCEDSWIGQALRNIPRATLDEADIWAKTAAAGGIPDPWQFLLDCHALDQQTKRVCRAAQSQRAALRRIVRIEKEIASRRTDWHKVALDARSRGDWEGFNRAMAKVADAYALYGQIEKEALEHADPEVREGFLAVQLKRRAQLVHRGKKADAEILKPEPSREVIRKHFPEECFLAENWVQLSCSPLPGLMFWSNAAITSLLFAWKRMKRESHANLGRDYVEKFRRRLGLVPVGRESLLILTATVQPLSGQRFRISGCRRNGEVVFSEILPCRI